MNTIENTTVMTDESPNSLCEETAVKVMAEEIGKQFIDESHDTLVEEAEKCVEVADETNDTDFSDDSFDSLGEEVADETNDTDFSDDSFDSLGEEAAVETNDSNDSPHFAAAKKKKIYISLEDAVLAGDTEACKEMLEHGASVNDKYRTEDKWTELQSAAYRGYVEICELLLLNKADVDAKDEHGSTSLHWAAYDGRMEICKVLLKHGADVNAKDEEGSTPLHEAAINGQTEACKLLIEHGANVNAEDNFGSTPLFNASAKGSMATCKLLLRHGADRSEMFDLEYMR